MGIRSVLKHRASVHRKVGASWTTVAEDVPCLLSTSSSQPDPTMTSEAQATLDRMGVLFTLPSADVLHADRVRMTRGASGTFLIKNDPALIPTLRGPSHREHRVEEVSG